ncbi:hypothetical protein E2C01_099709 [Portunus trituberculatus]|uniref:Uncharacterized protein n=1 Tax=Portunus trituberculatus TaxID=210409 RepID=A0A5B7K4H6_PORTR|nr:hypothetical protein [Portunus trituberculatus]
MSSCRNVKLFTAPDDATEQRRGSLHYLCRLETQRHTLKNNTSYANNGLSQHKTHNKRRKPAQRGVFESCSGLMRLHAVCGYNDEVTRFSSVLSPSPFTLHDQT